VLTIDSVFIADGKLYYDFDSFDPSIGTIDRNYLEVITTDDLDSLIPLVDGNTYTIEFDDGQP
jgi:hypothetical protein